jgi:hypothetical protein
MMELEVSELEIEIAPINEDNTSFRCHSQHSIVGNIKKSCKHLSVLQESLVELLKQNTTCLSSNHPEFSHWF